MSPPMGTSIRPREGEWWQLQQRIIDRWIRRGLIGDLGGPVLKTDLFDEASGPHHHLKDLDPGILTIGMDWDLGVARAAQTRLAQAETTARLVVCDVRAIPFAASSLASALSLSTLDHFESTESIVDSLSELARVLRAGGRLLLTLDNPWNPEVLLRAWLPSGIVRRLRADDFPLGRTMNLRQAERVFRDLHLEVMRKEYLMHSPRYLGIRMLNWLGRMQWHGVVRSMARLLELLEVVSGSPLRSVTGHFIAWHLEKVAHPSRVDRPVVKGL